MLAHISHHEALLAQWQEKIQEIEEGTSPMLARRLAHTSAADREKTIAYKTFTYEGLIARAEAEIAWARRGLNLIERLNG